MSDNSDLADYLAGGSFDPDFEFNMKKNELSKDTRINKERYSNIDAAYKEWTEFKSSEIYRNIERSKNLLSKDFSIDNDALQDAMKTNYSISDMEYNRVLEQLANSSDIEVRRSLFDNKIKLRKK
jgi:hypothetical protein